MTIDDQLLHELFKPDKNVKVGKGALIKKVVRTRILSYALEESSSYTVPSEDFRTGAIEVVKITPDIIVNTGEEAKPKIVVIEVENDIQWDFQSSLRQVKKYTQWYEDVRVIIPYKYKMFAPLYENEGLRVYLWQAKRKWQCLRCDHITVNESRVPPRCEGKRCDNKNRSEFDLVGLEGADINEY